MRIIATSASQILPRLWLGDINNALDTEFIIKAEISVIVNCTKDLPFATIARELAKYRVPVDDNLSADEIAAMADKLARVVEVIRAHYEAGQTILVHCAAGIQRSAIVVLSYLYVYHTQNARVAYALIKLRRPIAFTPTMHFRESFNRAFRSNRAESSSRTESGISSLFGWIIGT